jgi:glycosyltransferase involved in cell wall biosynthesis
MDKTISIVTATKNRPFFVKHLRHNIESLDYDKELIEWVIVDDGDQSAFSLVKDFPNLVYHYTTNHIPLGRKRNLANSLTSGEFIFNFDDDNYAFQNRIKKSIEFLEINPDCDLVGSSEMFVLDLEIGQAYVAGPFSNNHATLGTWAFHRSLLEKTSFLDTDLSGEEVGFTKRWTLRIGQLDKFSTSVCVDHGKNTVSKKHLLADATAFFALEEVIESDFSVNHFKALILQRSIKQD